MRAHYNCSAPGIIKTKDTNEVIVSHNHCSNIDYNSYQYKKNLDQEIDHTKIALKGCIAFFKTVSESKEFDPEIRASATGALAEDQANLEDLEKHRSSGCVIL